MSGKQLLFLSSKKLEGMSTKDGNFTYELLLPVETYWELQKLMKEIEYMTSSFEDPVAVADMHKKILSKVVNFVVHEKDRLQLKEKIDGTSAK